MGNSIAAPCDPGAGRMHHGHSQGGGLQLMQVYPAAPAGTSSYPPPPSPMDDRLLGDEAPPKPTQKDAPSAGFNLAQPNAGPAPDLTLAPAPAPAPAAAPVLTTAADFAANLFQMQAAAPPPAPEERHDHPVIVAIEDPDDDGDQSMNASKKLASPRYDPPSAAASPRPMQDPFQVSSPPQQYQPGSQQQFQSQQFQQPQQFQQQPYMLSPSASNPMAASDREPSHSEAPDQNEHPDDKHPDELSPRQSEPATDDDVHPDDEDPRAILSVMLSEIKIPDKTKLDGTFQVKVSVSPLENTKSKKHFELKSKDIKKGIKVEKNKLYESLNDDFGKKTLLVNDYHQQKLQIVLCKKGLFGLTKTVVGNAGIDLAGFEKRKQFGVTLPWDFIPKHAAKGGSVMVKLKLTDAE